MKDIVKSVVKSNNCIGCGLCINFLDNCYGMQLSKEGFYRPKKMKKIKIDTKKEKSFKKICPGFIRRENLDKDNEIGIWGKYSRILTTYSSNDKIRYKAATGGTLTAVLLYLIENNLVDKVLQVRTNNKIPYISQYDISTSREDIISSIGSRYTPCFMFSKLKEIIQSDGKLAIVGKPCDIATLKRYLKEFKQEEKVFVYITFLCAGTPSLNATLNILSKNNIDKSIVKNINYRGNGWPGYLTVKDGNKELLKLKYEDYWNDLAKNIQESCDICADGIGEMADIVLGDAWNLKEDGKIDFGESDGVNLTIIRTETGEKVLKGAIEKGYVTVNKEYLDEETLNKMQPNHYMRRKQLYYKMIGKRLAFKKLPYIPKRVFKRYAKDEKKTKKIRIILSTIKKELIG